jgi:hypothetical protein
MVKPINNFNGVHRLFYGLTAQSLRRRLAVEVIVHLRVQNPLGQRLFQLIEKPVLGKHLLWIAPRE